MSEQITRAALHFIPRPKQINEKEIVLRRIQQIFQLSESESRKVIAFAALGMTLQAGLSLGTSTADSLFLTHLGADKLPYVFIVTPLVLSAYLIFYSCVLAHRSTDRALELALYVLIGIGALLSLALSLDDVLELKLKILYVLKTYSIFWYFVLYSLYWNFIDSYFDILSGKRLFALLGAGSAIGAAAGGAIASSLAEHLSTEQLFFFWPVFGFSSLAVLRHCRKTYERMDLEVGVEEEESVAGQLKGLIGLFQKSRFAVALAATVFLIMSITIVCEYQYLAVFAKSRSESELTALFGKLYFSVSIFNLFVSSFLFQRIVQVLGVRNTALIQPIAYVFVFACFVVDGSMWVAYLGFFAFQGLLTSIDFTNSSLLMNALPKEGKKQLRTCIEVLCEPFAHALVGVFLLMAIGNIEPAQLSLVGFAVSILALLVTLAMRHSYVGAMVRNLRNNWLDLSSQESSLPVSMNRSELSMLRDKLASDLLQNSERRSFDLGLSLLAEQSPKEALSVISEALRMDVTLRAETFESALRVSLAQLGTAEVEQFVLSLSSLQKNLSPTFVVSLGRLELLRPTEALEARAREWLSRGSPTELIAAAAVYRSLNGEQALSELSVRLANLVQGTTAEQATAIRMIEFVRITGASQRFADGLSSSCPLVQNATLETLNRLPQFELRGFLGALQRIFPTLNEAGRIVAFDLLARHGQSSLHFSVLSQSERFSPPERRRIGALVGGLGLDAVPRLVLSFKNHTAHRNVRSTAARTLARVSPNQFESCSNELIEEELSLANQDHLAFHALSVVAEVSCGARVLRRSLKDMVDERRDFILEILCLNGRIGSYELLSAKLQSRNVKERANAIETVQQGCEQALFRRLHALFDDTFQFDSEGTRQDPEAILIQLVRKDNELRGAAAAQALHELYAAKSQPLLFSELRANPGSIRGDTIRILLSRLRAEKTPTLVERVDAILSSQLCADFRVEELLQLERSGEFVTICEEQSEQITKDYFYIVTDGLVRLESGGVERTLSKGQTFGMERLLGQSPSVCSAVFGAPTCYRFPKASLEGLACNSREVAKSIFAVRAAEGYGA